MVRIATSFDVTRAATADRAGLPVPAKLTKTTKTA